MAKTKYRVIAEDTVVAGHSKGEEFSFPPGDYNVEALIDGGFIEPVKASSKTKEEEK